MVTIREVHNVGLVFDFGVKKEFFDQLSKVLADTNGKWAKAKNLIPELRNTELVLPKESSASLAKNIGALSDNSDVVIVFAALFNNEINSHESLYDAGHQSDSPIVTFFPTPEGYLHK